ncbi:MAG: hypothetical protein Q8K99_05940 [Actinomycetota bacterium]|nr:hypothetical protein [Actinomycetota bacterium]
MTRLQRLCVGALAAALVLAALPACKKTPAEEPSPARESASITASGWAAATSTPEPATATGEITTPKTGTALRTALMDAARAKLGTKSQFYVYQLFVQGNTALGDIETVDGGVRSFVAWSGPVWEAEWSATYGSHGASTGDARTTLPSLSDELLRTLNWDMPKPAPAAAMKASLSDEVVKWSSKLMSGAGAPYKIAVVKVAQANDGTWWGRAIVQPMPGGGNAYEPLNFWCSYVGAEWTGQAQDPEPPAPMTYFPSDVIDELF